MVFSCMPKVWMDLGVSGNTIPLAWHLLNS